MHAFSTTQYIYFQLTHHNILCYNLFVIDFVRSFWNYGFFPYSTRCSGLYVVRLYSYALKRVSGNRTLFVFVGHHTLAGMSLLSLSVREA